MGLIARAIETNGIATVAISITKDLTEAVGVPRTIFVKWPMGHPMGEPGATLQQRTMIFNALALLVKADNPGVIEEPNYRWRRQEYTEPDWNRLVSPAS